ncbi:hypothetical protein RJ639_042372 [Escallonia herrerae]|uniref:Calcineurin-like phosphoesterase domain-containing protein n=1 Tax=Escallonia herrerae TaxID=1293975 RepID=A0AA88WJZ8_9ASTE|nr:hypothetical protein RJ639_042372 [Escallonia herrerae]
MVVWLLPSSSSLPQQPLHLFCPSYKLALRKCNREIRQNCTKRPQVPPLANGEAVAGLRLFVLSDLHTDYPENMTWVKSLSTTRHKKDVLLVAGDVAETCKNFVQTMSILKDRFEHVFYVPGNHDLWCRWEKDDYTDSLEKLSKLLEACRRIGVETNPTVVDGLGIVPLFSWYHKSFDREEDITGIRIPSLEMVEGGSSSGFGADLEGSWPLGAATGEVDSSLSKSQTTANLGLSASLRRGADIVVEESSMVDRLSFLKHCLVGRLSRYGTELPSALVVQRWVDLECKVAGWVKVADLSGTFYYYEFPSLKEATKILEVSEQITGLLSCSVMVNPSNPLANKFWVDLVFLGRMEEKLGSTKGNRIADFEFGLTGRLCWDTSDVARKSGSDRERDRELDVALCVKDVPSDLQLIKVKCFGKFLGVSLDGYEDKIISPFLLEFESKCKIVEGVYGLSINVEDLPLGMVFLLDFAVRKVLPSQGSEDSCLRQIGKACKDFHACKWPKELLKEDASLASYFDVMNNKNQDAINEIQQTCSQIISFSHFVPR